MILLFAGTACVAGYKIYDILHEYHAGEETYNRMAQYVTPSVTASVLPEPDIMLTERQEEPSEEDPGLEKPEEVPEEEPTEPVLFPVVDFASLRQINSDVIAWISIENTKVNYPIVQGTDNDHYLSWTVDGKKNSAGSIFIDYRNEPDFSDQNTVIYGHNMSNGTMFANIRNYRTQEYYENHPNILIITPDENHLYEVVAGFVTQTDGPAWQISFSSEELTLEWIREAISKSYFASNIVPELGDTYITLSTCTYEFDNARFVLVAVRR